MNKKLKKINLGMLLIFISYHSFANTSYFLNYDETISLSPEKTQNELPLLPTLCQSREKGLWDLCFSIVKDSENRDDREYRAKSIKLKNTGGNPTFPPTGWMIGRDFEFQFEDLAQSDLGLLVWDMPMERDSSGHLMLMTFLPRKVIPSVQYESENKIKLTLPTEETVIFDASTKEIKSGVLKEGTLKVNSQGVALRPSLTYTGSGLVLVASRVANYPVGDEFINGQKRQARNLADIFYNGTRLCQIPVKDLWYTDYSKNGQVLMKPGFGDDQKLIAFIEKKCKTKISL